MLLFHETTADWRPRGDDLCFAGRDSAKLGSPVRPPTACRAVGCPGHELQAGCNRIRRCTPHCGVLGEAIRLRRVWRTGRRRTIRTALSIERCGSRTGRAGTAEDPGRLWSGRSTVGRADLVGVSEEAVGYRPACTAVPANVSTDGLSLAQTQTTGGLGRSAVAGGTQKNSANWRQTRLLTSGRWMKSIFSSTEAAAGCGCRLRSVIPSAGMRPRARASVISVPCVFETESSVSPNPAEASMHRPAGHFFAAFAAPVPDPAAAWSSSLTTQGTITLRSMRPGARNRSPGLACTSFRRTALNSTPLSAYGNSFVASVSTTSTSLRSKNLLSPLMLSFVYGPSPTQCSRDSVPCNSMRKQLRRCV